MLYFFFFTIFRFISRFFKRKGVEDKDADECASNVGSYLATFTSPQEFLCIRSVVPQGGRVWLGGSRKSDGTFGWDTGESFEYAQQFFSDGEPNNDSDGGKGGEHCLEFLEPTSLNDQSCDLVPKPGSAGPMMGFVVERGPFMDEIVD